MFEKSPIFVLEGIRGNRENCKVSTLDIDENTRESITKMFDSSVHQQIIGKRDEPYDEIPYDPACTLQPDELEYMCIPSFELPLCITEAIPKRATLPQYELEADAVPEIRAFFVCHPSPSGDKLAFQRFRSQQYLSPAGFHLFFSHKTLRQQNASEWNRGKGRAGISISSIVDCFVDEHGLKLKSSFFPNQIFDLSTYALEATEEQVKEFIDHDIFDSTDPKLSIESIKTRERKKIASITEKRILVEHSIEEIAGVARQFDYDLPLTQDGKILMPSDSKRRKELLAFLDEDIYRGSFSEEIYYSNSKRKRNGR